MKKEKFKNISVRQSRFSPAMFGMYLIAFFLILGVHTGLLLLIWDKDWSEIAKVIIPVVYWCAVSVGLTLFTRSKVRSTYEEPMHNLAEAAESVADGDFSVYVPPVHTQDKWDYLDVMIINFNKMVEELGSIETLKTDFFSNVSHEIKTPIAVVQNSAEMLKNTRLTDEERQMYIDTIIQASKKLSELITNILKLSKLEKQNIQPVMEEHDLCEQLCRCSLQFENVWEEKDIEFEAELEDRVMISADESLLELVWTNLLSNALKFTGNGGKVRLVQTSTEDEVVVSVIDTGCGMDDETMEHIFDKFYQGDTSHSASGNGLGLALALRIINMLGGAIQVESEQGQGSTFTVRLHIAAARDN